MACSHHTALKWKARDGPFFFGLEWIGGVKLGLCIPATTEGLNLPAFLLPLAGHAYCFYICSQVRGNKICVYKHIQWFLHISTSRTQIQLCWSVRADHHLWWQATTWADQRQRIAQRREASLKWLLPLPHLPSMVPLVTQLTVKHPLSILNTSDCYPPCYISPSFSLESSFLGKLSRSLVYHWPPPPALQRPGCSLRQLPL